MRTRDQPSPEWKIGCRLIRKWVDVNEAANINNTFCRLSSWIPTPVAIALSFRPRCRPTWTWLKVGELEGVAWCETNPSPFLLPVKLWHSVDIGYSEQLKMAFITGQRTKDVSPPIKLLIESDISIIIAWQRWSLGAYYHCRQAPTSPWKGVSFSTSPWRPCTTYLLNVVRFSEFFVALKDHIPCCHGDQRQAQLTLSLVDSDSTIVYYHVTDGIQQSN